MKPVILQYGCMVWRGVIKSSTVTPVLVTPRVYLHPCYTLGPYRVICTPSSQAIASLIIRGSCFPIGSFANCLSSICLLTVSESAFVVGPPSFFFHRVTVASLQKHQISPPETKNKTVFYHLIRFPLFHKRSEMIFLSVIPSQWYWPNSLATFSLSAVAVSSM